MHVAFKERQYFWKIEKGIICWPGKNKGKVSLFGYLHKIALCVLGEYACER
jgi:hypothetical protein